VTPVAIYFVLKLFPIQGYHILAGLDLIVWVVTVYSVTKFKEIDVSYQRVGKSFKENFLIQWHTLIESLKFIRGSKSLIQLVFLYAFGSSYFYVSSIFYPYLAKLGFQDYLVSFLVWILSIVMIV